MIEAKTPRYHDVPCPDWTYWFRGRCMSNPGQPCGFQGSHRQRRLLWAAMAEAQSRGQYVVWWYGKAVQVTTRLVRE